MMFSHREQVWLLSLDSIVIAALMVDKNYGISDLLGKLGYKVAGTGCSAINPGLSLWSWLTSPFWEGKLGKSECKVAGTGCSSIFPGPFITIPFSEGISNSSGAASLASDYYKLCELRGENEIFQEENEISIHEKVSCAPLVRDMLSRIPSW